MFRILELKGVGLAPATEVGRGYSTREEALAAVKTHLKAFKASGHNPEGIYWWARDAEGLRKCWISSIDGETTVNGRAQFPKSKQIF